MTNVVDLTVLLCGYTFARQAAVVPGEGGDIVLALPISAYLIRTLNGALLFDTGLDRANLADPVRRDVLFTARGHAPPPLVDEAHDLAAQLGAAGLSLGDIDTAIVSHLHAEHTGGLKSLTHARTVLQRAEHAAAFVPGGPPDPARLPSDYDHPAVSFTLLDGDTVLDEGLTVLATPGHTEGHQSLLVELPRTGPVILAGGAGVVRRNLVEGIVAGQVADRQAALASMRRISGLAWALPAAVVLSHDPDQMKDLRRSPHVYD